MTPREFDAWVEFYRQFPFDDLHRYHRPTALISQGLRGGAIKPLLAWLTEPIAAPPVAATGGLSESDIRTLQALGLKTRD